MQQKIKNQRCDFIQYRLGQPKSTSGRARTTKRPCLFFPLPVSTPLFISRPKRISQHPSSEYKVHFFPQYSREQIVNDVWTTNHETDALGSGLTAKSHVETDWQRAVGSRAARYT